MNVKLIIRGVIAVACFFILPGLGNVALAQTDPGLPDPIMVDPDTTFGYGGAPAFYLLHIGPPMGQTKGNIKNPILPIRPGPAGPIITPSVSSKDSGVMGHGTPGMGGGGGGLFYQAGGGVSHRPDPAPVMKELASVRTALGL